MEALRLRKRHPYMVAVRNFNRFDCSGVLIGCHTVLTAAQCVDERHGRDRLPVLWLNAYYTERETNDTLIRRSSDVRVHPNYTGDVVDGYDFAILLIDEPAHGLIPIRTTPEEYLGVNVDRELSLLGFGRSTRTSSRTPYVQITRLDIIDPTACRNSEDVIFLEDQMLCLEGNTPCSGDQGGPIFPDSGLANSDTLYGIVSSTVCDLSSRIAAVPSTIRREVYDWISSTMEELENTVSGRRTPASAADLLGQITAAGPASELDIFDLIFESTDGC